MICYFYKIKMWCFIFVKFSLKIISLNWSHFNMEMKALNQKYNIYKKTGNFMNYYNVLWDKLGKETKTNVLWVKKKGGSVFRDGRKIAIPSFLNRRNCSFFNPKLYLLLWLHVIILVQLFYRHLFTACPTMRVSVQINATISELFSSCKLKLM